MGHLLDVRAGQTDIEGRVVRFRLQSLDHRVQPVDERLRPGDVGGPPIRLDQRGEERSVAILIVGVRREQGGVFSLKLFQVAGDPSRTVVQPVVQIDQEPGLFELGLVNAVSDLVVEAIEILERKIKEGGFFQKFSRRPVVDVTNFVDSLSGKFPVEIGEKSAGRLGIFCLDGDDEEARPADRFFEFTGLDDGRMIVRKKIAEIAPDLDFLGEKNGCGGYQGGKKEDGFWVAKGNVNETDEKGVDLFHGFDSL